MNADEFKEQMEKIAKDPHAYGFHECALCGKPEVKFVGVCIPDSDGELARVLQAEAPEGKRRSMLYALCGQCAEDDMREYGNIEERLLKTMRGQYRPLEGLFGSGHKAGKSRMLATSTFLVFYSSGQRFKLDGFWGGVKHLERKVIAPSIVNEKGEYNVVDPRALVIRADDGAVIYNCRDYVDHMDDALVEAMPADWPMKLLEQLKPLWRK